MKRKKYLVLKKYLASDLLCGHGEQGGDAQGDPGGDSVGVQPEADPGDDDEHAAGDVDRDQVVGELPLEDQLHLEAAVLACNSGDEVVIYTTGRIIMSCRHCHSSLGVLFPGGGHRGMNVNKWMMKKEKRLGVLERLF